MDLVLCLCDSLNYVIDLKNIKQAFKNTYASLKKGGTFIFDIDSMYKMETILNHSFAHQKYFEEMTRIPHGSFHEEAYSAYLEEFAKAHQFTYERDEMNNV